MYSFMIPDEIVHVYYALFVLRFIFVYLCNYDSSRTIVSQAKKGGGSKDLTMAAEQTSHLQTLG